MDFPFSFFVAAALVVALCADLWRYRREAWALPALIIYLTVAAWYFSDPILYGEKYREMPPVLMSRSYWQVFAFLVFFRLAARPLSTRFVRRAHQAVPTVRVNLRLALLCNVSLWAVLLCYGTSRMEWDLFGALFPLDSRNGNLLWLRASAGDAGPTGFIVSTCGYLYSVSSAFFGIILVLSRAPATRLGATGMIAIAWPFFLLCGTRNQFLAVCMPMIFTYALFGRSRWVVRTLMLLLAFALINYSLKLVISRRNYGFRDLLTMQQTTEEENGPKSTAETEHEGLNMTQELCYINIYVDDDKHALTWGMDYLGNLLNMVPRVLWPGKPLLGVEYAKWRGFGGGSSDIGVVATVSSGLIGQGLLEFGPIFGPVAPALLMALWCGLLSRWWAQRASLLRLSLFMISLGVTFNLGRNISALILWPVAFAYAIVLLVEKLRGRRTVFRRSLANRSARVNVVPPPAIQPALPSAVTRL